MVSRFAYRKNQTQNKYPNLENQTRKSNIQTQKMKTEKQKKNQIGLRGLVVHLLLRRWWFRIQTSQALKITTPFSLCLTMLNPLELWDL